MQYQEEVNFFLFHEDHPEHMVFKLNALSNWNPMRMGQNVQPTSLVKLYYSNFGVKLAYWMNKGCAIIIIRSQM